MIIETPQVLAWVDYNMMNGRAGYCQAGSGANRLCCEG
jgi:hypothetical protein